MASTGRPASITNPVPEPTCLDTIAVPTTASLRGSPTSVTNGQVGQPSRLLVEGQQSNRAATTGTVASATVQPITTPASMSVTTVSVTVASDKQRPPDLSRKLQGLLRGIKDKDKDKEKDKDKGKDNSLMKAEGHERLPTLLAQQPPASEGYPVPELSRGHPDSLADSQTLRSKPALLAARHQVHHDHHLLQIATGRGGDLSSSSDSDLSHHDGTPAGGGSGSGSGSGNGCGYNSERSGPGNRSLQPSEPRFARRGADLGDFQCERPEVRTAGASADEAAMASHATIVPARPSSLHALPLAVEPRECPIVLHESWLQGTAQRRSGAQAVHLGALGPPLGARAVAAAAEATAEAAEALARPGARVSVTVMPLGKQSPEEVPGPKGFPLPVAMPVASHQGAPRPAAVVPALAGAAAPVAALAANGVRSPSSHPQRPLAPPPPAMQLPAGPTAASLKLPRSPPMPVSFAEVRAITLALAEAVETGHEVS